MKRLPITDTSLASLQLDEAELKQVVNELGAAAAYDDSGIHDLHTRLAAIHGRWWAERGAKETAPVVNALGKLASHLAKITELLSGHDTGLHNPVVIETTSQIVCALARNTAVSSVDAARGLIETFKRDAAKVQDACSTAFADLTAPSPKEGRDRFGWYDEFTEVLLEIAGKVGIKPALGKDRTSGKRNGWLFDAALALERFFPSYMRSWSPEACGKRLERSRKHLLNTHRQIRASR
jgi:hypothetical protein